MILPYFRKSWVPLFSRFLIKKTAQQVGWVRCLDAAHTQIADQLKTVHIDMRCHHFSSMTHTPHDPYAMSHPAPSSQPSPLVVSQGMNTKDAVYRKLTKCTIQYILLYTQYNECTVLQHPKMLFCISCSSAHTVAHKCMIHIIHTGYDMYPTSAGYCSTQYCTVYTVHTVPHCFWITDSVSLAPTPLEPSLVKTFHLEDISWLTSLLYCTVLYLIDCITWMINGSRRTCTCVSWRPMIWT